MSSFSQDWGLDLVDATYAAAAEPARWGEALRELASQVQAPRAVLYLRSEAPLRTSAHTYGYDAEFSERYRSIYAAQDPFMPYVTAHPRGAVVRSSGLLSSAEWEDSALYQELFRPAGLYYSVAAVLRNERGGSLAILALSRDRSDGDFGSSSDRVLRWIAPHLERALALNAHTELCKQEVWAQRVLLDRLPVGVVLLDCQARVSWSSESARRILERGRVVSMRNQRLLARSKVDARDLERLLDQLVRSPASSVSSSRPRALRIGTRDMLEIVGLPVIRPNTLVESHSVAAVLLLGDGSVDFRASLGVIAQLYQLTPTESLVASLVTGGSSLQQAAERLGVRISTVRTHFKHIAAKMGAHGQIGVVRRILTGPLLMGRPAPSRSVRSVPVRPLRRKPRGRR